MSHSEGKLARRSTTLTRPDFLEQRRTSVWCIRLGFHYGRGLSSHQVAHLLNEGLLVSSEAVLPETVRTMVQKADLPSPGRRRVIVPLTLESFERDALQRRADERRITVHELLYRFVKDGLVLDDLYMAVTDGRYE